jgi:hypothetical protein
MVTMCALTPIEPLMTRRSSACAAERVDAVRPAKLVLGVWMAAKISAARDSSAPNSSASQIAAVWCEARHARLRRRLQCAHLDDLGHAIRELAGGKRLEEGRVDEDILRLPKGADKVLAGRCVNRRFAADTRVNHCEERRWDLHKAHAAHAVTLSACVLCLVEFRKERRKKKKERLLQPLTAASHRDHVTRSGHTVKRSGRTMSNRQHALNGDISGSR